MWLRAIVLDSTTLEPLLNVLLEFHQNSHNDGFMKDYGYSPW